MCVEHHAAATFGARRAPPAPFGEEGPDSATDLAGVVAGILAGLRASANHRREVPARLIDAVATRHLRGDATCGANLSRTEQEGGGEGDMRQGMGRGRRKLVRHLAMWSWATLASLASTTALPAQRRIPSQGGTTVSLGQPVKWQWSFGAATGVRTQPGDEAADLLISAGGEWVISTPRFPFIVHGAGCCYSAAICAHLARGCTVQEAFSRSKEWMNRLFRKAERAPSGIFMLSSSGFTRDSDYSGEMEA